MKEILELLNETLLGISAWKYAASFLILILSLLLKKILGHFFINILTPFARKTASTYDDLILKAIRKPAEFTVIIAGFFIVVQILNLPTEPLNLNRFAYATLKILITFDIAWMLFNTISVLETYLARMVQKTESTLDDHLIPFIRKSLRAFIVFIAFILTVQNLGYSISGLLASLGIGGLAVALAARETLSNVFGSFMIILDRPFHIGDWIKAGDMEGVVEEIGFRSTKIRTFAKTEISVPNNIIANMPLDNFSRMPKRRIKLNVGVTYDTTPAKMQEAVHNIRHMLEKHPGINQEFMLVNFTDFGPSSLDILVYCFTSTTDWAEYLQIRQEVSLNIMIILEELGLEIAFPSQSVYLRQEDAGNPPLSRKEKPEKI
jgi:MscS family membrane protein